MNCVSKYINKNASQRAAAQFCSAHGDSLPKHRRSLPTSMLKWIFILFISTAPFACQQQKVTVGNKDSFPKLILQKSAVAEIQDGIEKYPMLKTTFQEAKEIADKGIDAGIVVPFPKDPGGGYTHEKHKQNYLEMYNAGLVYQLTGEEKYAVFVRDMLVEYAKLYPTLGIHPEQKNQAPGKLFWQGLNESVWLVYTIQAYDCIHDFLTEEQQKNIEENLFRNVIRFFTVEDSYSFDRVHNHGTWTVAGVGMTAMVLNDSILLQKALYSTKLDGSGGFLKQIDELFSPDGYYAEGPYYQRYSMMPFILFAQALENNLPEYKIFEYKNGVLIKAVNTVLQLTSSDGNFYPINDAMREKSWLTPEMIFGTNIVYKLTNNTYLLDVAQKQRTVMISAEGLAVAKSIANGKSTNFTRKSMIINDGKNGDMGGLALLRIGEKEEQSSVLFKFSSQGMGHGHFDRLGFILYDRGKEIIPDYGSARFLNINAKDGGRYLPENETWSKQTVAHNTLVVDEQSNFNFKLKNAEKYSPQLIFSAFNSNNFQIVSATDSNCYEGVILNRTLTFLEVDGRKYLIDIFDVKNRKTSSYDVPVYFNGHFITSNFPLNRKDGFEILGNKNGYQHLKVDARANGLPETASVTWMNGNGFYTMSVLTSSNTEMIFTRLGANDPNYNLREQQGFMLRWPALGNAKFLTVFELHGNYNPVSEIVMQSEGSVKNLRLVSGNDEKVWMEIQLRNDKKIQLLIDLKFQGNASNEIVVDGTPIQWKGNHELLIK